MIIISLFMRVRIHGSEATLCDSPVRDCTDHHGLSNRQHLQGGKRPVRVIIG